MKRKHGFTLLEVIIAVAIVGVLASILIPTFMRYVEIAKKRATIANAKILYTDVMDILEDNIVNNEEAYKAIFTEKGSKWCFQSTADGCYTGQFKGNLKDANAQKKKDQSDPTKKDYYWLNVLFRADGRWHETGTGKGDRYSASAPDRIFNTWNDADYDGPDARHHNYFIERLCASENLQPYVEKGQQFPLKIPYTEREDGGAQPVVRWLICQRTDSTETIEIWLGDGTKAKNGPVYRIYPDPAPIYKD